LFHSKFPYVPASGERACTVRFRQKPDVRRRAKCPESGTGTA
jgi:hypothetical protein